MVNEMQDRSKIVALKKKFKNYVVIFFEKYIIPFLEKRLSSLLVLFSSFSNELKQRIFVGIAIAFGITICIVFGNVIYIVVIFGICCLMVYELIGMVSKIEHSNSRNFLLLRRWGLVYVVICCVSLVLIRESEQGLKVSLWMYLVIWSVDVGAYIFGKKFGKLKLAPEISPNKTYEGAILGSFCGLIVSVLLYNTFSSGTQDAFSLYSHIIFTLIVVILAQLGDLSESFVKRLCGVKDSGNILPGHGGMLDRFDSFLIVAPFIFVVLFFNGGILF